MTTVYIDRGLVLKHLSKLKLDDVPEELLDSFVRDLENHMTEVEKKDVKIVEFKEKPKSKSTHQEPLRRSPVSHPPTRGHDFTQETRFMKKKVFRGFEGGKPCIEESFIESTFSVAYDTEEESLQDLSSSTNTPDSEDHSSSETLPLDSSHGKTTYWSRPPCKICPTTACPHHLHAVERSSSARSCPVHSGIPKKKKSLKCDPVSRYHHYKSGWDHMKLPGEETWKGIRWDVRGWMMGCRPDPKPRTAEPKPRVQVVSRRRPEWT